AAADKQTAHGNQQQPEATQRQIELRHEGAVGGQNAQTFLGDHGCDGTKYRERRKIHHVAGYFQHDLGAAGHQLDHRLGGIAQGGGGQSKEEGEHHYLQDLVGGHGLYHAFRYGVGDKVLEGDGGDDHT